MKKILALFGVMFLLVGWTYDDLSPYMICNCSLGNGIKIVFPTDKIEYLRYDLEKGKIWNESSQNIYGYYGADTRITFPTYGEPYYNSSYNSVNLSISSISKIDLYPSTTLKEKFFGSTIIITLIGGIFICIFTRH